MASPGAAPIVPVVMIIGGGYLAWFGVHYWRSDVRWPTDPVKAILTGKPVPDPTHAAEQADLQGLQNLMGTLTTTANTSGVNAGTPPTGGGNPLDPGGFTTASGALSHSQLEDLWRANGGNPATANVAAAVGQAESSGRPAVTSPNPDGGVNVGIWQLDTKGKGAGYTIAQLQDPATNARITVMGSANGSSWSAWAAYGNGAYRQYLVNTPGQVPR